MQQHAATYLRDDSSRELSSVPVLVSWSLCFAISVQIHQYACHERHCKAQFAPPHGTAFKFLCSTRRNGRAKRLALFTITSGMSASRLWTCQNSGSQKRRHSITHRWRQHAACRPAQHFSSYCSPLSTISRTENRKY